MQGTNFLFVGVLIVQFITTSSATITDANNHNTSSIASDLNALLAFKATISDPQRIIATNWSTSTSVCNWIGVTCNTRHRRVAAIDLSYMGISGTIPPQLGNLSFLVYLNVKNNSFHGRLLSDLYRLRRLNYINLAANFFEGEFPSWLGSLNELRVMNLAANKFSGSLSGSGISNFTNLEKINLGYNFITGEIPGEFGTLSKLNLLGIEYNKLVGTLPRALFNLSSLQVIAFTGNSLSGYLPARICDHLPQLQWLYLSENDFEGEIPSGIGECSQLQQLSLSTNKFTGHIPQGIWNLTVLTVMYLGDSHVTGEIPKAIGNLNNLVELDIWRANLTGMVPREIGNLSKLERISLGLNRLRGPIPHKLLNMSSVQLISFEGNNLSGELPSTLGVFLPNLEELYLSDNAFTGNILTSISNASKLRNLDIGLNHFTGAIPHSLGNLRSLKDLNIQKNGFSGDSRSRELSFLLSFANCRNLTRLWIAENPLNGYLPKFIGNLSTSLESIVANNCGLEDEIPSSIGNLSNLVEVLFAGNNLTGTIPSTIKSLLKLQRIGLTNNQIQGGIPSEFCYLSNLAGLYLEQNILSGAVPSCLGNVTILRYVYLNSNNLSSTIPTSFWSLGDMLEVDMSVNSLTGSLPDEIQNFKVLVHLNLSNNQFVGEIPSTIGALQNLQNLSLEHNNLKGRIPDSTKKLLQLQYLDLSFNNLEGEIPDSLQMLSYLRFFNVSYNRLRGSIPHGGPFVNFTSLSFLSNQALCGVPWLQPCPSASEDESRTKLIVMIVLLAVGSLMLVLVISIILIRLKFKKKTHSPAGDLPPMATFEKASLYELRQITNEFSESNLLGSGTFGSVYKGVRQDGTIWAIKVFYMHLEGAFNSFDKECEVLSSLRHRNLTKVITAVSSPDFKALVLEYMPNGSLENWLHSEHHFLEIRQRLDIMIDVACGLEYLHYGYSIPVVHCDLKPSNILLDQDMVGHVCDFGIAKLLGDEDSMVQTKTLATFGYIAPEYGQEGLVSTSSDVYSFGITLIETFTKRKPKDEMFKEELSIRDWVQESLPDSIIKVIDANLLHHKDLLVHRKLACISSVLELALNCTTHARTERTNMKDVVGALQKIKLQFIKDITPEACNNLQNQDQAFYSVLCLTCI